jgi:2-polyprenyl-3-methyl-5-hydroxy-6-metoxy-1,4-benzoquinol methylase
MNQYNRDRVSHTAPIFPPLLLMLPSPENVSERKIRILDLGCGNGSLTNTLAKYGHEMVGIEESYQGIEIASHDFPNCKFNQQIPLQADLG